MKTNKLSELRFRLKERGLYGFIIPSNDPHFGEYIQDYYKCREWISGFTGSAGTVVVTLNQAALWTDSRYFIQAEMQLAGSGIELKKIGVAGEPTIADWLKDQYVLGYKIGIDSALFSVSDVESLKNQLSPFSLEMSDDLFVDVWQDRPSLKFCDLFGLDLSYCGVSTTDKLRQISKNNNFTKKSALITTVCDDIAWLCNLRGSDIEYNPLPMCKAIVTSSKIHLFCNLSGLSQQLISELNENKIEIYNYVDFENKSKEICAGKDVLINPDRTAYSVYSIIEPIALSIKFDTQRGGIIGKQKAVKNEVELEGFRKACEIDGVAWVKFLKKIEENVENGVIMAEHELEDEIQKIRAESEFYKGESFSPIVAFGASGAAPHYSLSKENPIILREGSLLLDTGGQYLYGTTDTTRTLFLGEPTEEFKADYTAVLKGMIALSCAVFKKGTRGASLDFLARGEVYKAGRSYLHGTGHGIGHFLCVHEGPQSIRMEENPVVLEVGMVQSNEPAIYVPGKYGIRIENMIACVESFKSDQGEFLEFETLTLVPIDLRLADLSKLCKSEIQWLKAYHSRVYDRLSVYLDDSEKRWLLSKTSSLD